MALYQQWEEDFMEQMALFWFTQIEKTRGWMVLSFLHFIHSRLNPFYLFEDMCPIKAKISHTNVLTG